MPFADLADAAKAQARDRLQAESAALALSRTRRFLVLQSTLVVIATVIVVGSSLGGVIDGILFIQSITFCLVTAIITALGWYLLRARRATTELVAGLLYVDVIVGAFFFYVGGEFETPFLSTLFLPIIMAPLFTDRRHAYGLATVVTTLYISLLVVRYFDLLPYGYMIPEAALQNPSLIADSVMGFVFVAFATAVLAGQASFEVLTSHNELRVAVERQTDLLARANDELQERNRALEQFNTELSHDLRSPLQTALAAAELLDMGPPALTPAQAKLADTVIQSVGRMGSLTRELLRLSQMEAGSEGFTDAPLGQLLPEVRADLAEMLRMTGATVELVQPLPVAHGSGSLLRELFQNLIENGVKYGKPGSPTVRIQQAAAPAGRVAVSVEDNGPGVPPTDRDRIFRPFVRLERDRGRDGGGHGLAIANRIVTAHGGTIRVEDALELSGARFVVELPKGG